jgi:hypothetical protein
VRELVNGVTSGTITPRSRSRSRTDVGIAVVSPSTRPR